MCTRLRITHTCHLYRAKGGRQGSTGSWKGVNYLKITIECHTYAHFFVATATRARVDSSPDYPSVGTKYSYFRIRKLACENFPLYGHVACPVIGVHVMHGGVHLNYRHSTNLIALTHSHPRGTCTSRSPPPILWPVISLQKLRLLGNDKLQQLLLDPTMRA